MSKSLYLVTHPMDYIITPNRAIQVRFSVVCIVNAILKQNPKQNSVVSAETTLDSRRAFANNTVRNLFSTTQKHFISIILTLIEHASCKLLDWHHLSAVIVHP